MGLSWAAADDSQMGSWLISELEQGSRANDIEGGGEHREEAGWPANGLLGCFACADAPAQSCGPLLRPEFNSSVSARRRGARGLGA